MPASSYQNISPMSTASTKIGTPEHLNRPQPGPKHGGGDLAGQASPPTFQLPAGTGNASSTLSSDDFDPFSDHNAVLPNSPATAAKVPRRSIYAGFPEYAEGYVAPADSEASTYADPAGQSKANGRKGSKAESFASSTSASSSSTTVSKKSSRASRLLGKLDFKYQGYNVGVGAINPSPRLSGGTRKMGPGDPSAGCVIS